MKAGNGRLVESLRRIATSARAPAPAFSKPHTRTFTLPEQIAENVAEAIIEGTYPPGSWIAEQDLADLFGVSRGPIRDALRILENEGLVQILPRRGTMVTQLTSNEVANIFSIRAALMGVAGRQTTERLTDAVKDMLLGSVREIDRLSRGQDAHEFLRAAYDASMLLARCSGNDRLFDLVLSMARQTLALTRQALANRENRIVWAKNWRAVVDEVVDDDPEGAERAARRLVIETGLRAAEYAAPDDAEHRAAGRVNALAGADRTSR